MRSYVFASVHLIVEIVQASKCFYQPPMSSRFCRYELRTTNVSAATDFYAALFGRRDLIIPELPVSAQTRGAPAHWLGYLSTTELGGSIVALQRWNDHGAMPVGARVGNGAVVRDPGGAMLALIDTAELVDAGVVLRVLQTSNAGPTELPDGSRIATCDDPQGAAFELVER
jgi:hypothetical protein